MESIKMISVEMFIRGLNSHEGFSCSLWEKHGMTRVYLNKLSGKKSAAYIEVVDGQISKIKNYCTATLSELISLAENPAASKLESELELAADPIVWRSDWKSVPGGGKISFYRTSSGHENFETEGVLQADLDDYLG